MKKKIIIATGLVLYELIFNNKNGNIKERNESIEAHISPIKLGSNNLIKFYNLKIDNNFINSFFSSYVLSYTQNYYSIYGIDLNLKLTFLYLNQIFKNILIYLHPEQVHYINCSNSFVNNRELKYLFNEMNNIYFKSNIPISIRLSSNNLTNVDFIDNYNISKGSLLHIQDNKINNIQPILNSNFEIIKVDWIKGNYNFSNSIKAINFYISNQEDILSTNNILKDSNLQMTEIFCLNFKGIISDDYIRSINDKLTSLTFANFNLENNDLSLINKNVNCLTLINCDNVKKIPIINNLKYLRLKHCNFTNDEINQIINSYKDINPIILIMQEVINLDKIDTKNLDNIVILNKDNRIQKISNSYIYAIMRASGDILFNINSINSKGGSNIIPFVFTKRGRISAIEQFAQYLCLNYVTIVPFIENNKIDLDELDFTFSKMNEDIRFKNKTIWIDLKKDDLNKVIDVVGKYFECKVIKK